jgi:hypothetical protein
MVGALFVASLTAMAACGSSSSSNGVPPDAGVGTGDSSADTGTVDTGTADTGSVDAGDGGSADAAFTPLGFPKVVNGGAPQMNAPKLVTVTFMGDTMASQLQSFGQGISATTWWDYVLADYCQNDAGTCPAQAAVSSPQTVAAGASYVDTATGDPAQLPTGGTPIWDLISSEIESGTVPPPDFDTMYILYFPSTTTVNLDGSNGCSNSFASWDGYHNQMTYTPEAGAPIPVAYSIVMECPGYMVSDVTFTATHEIVETITDGYYDSSGNGGWYLDLNDVNTWGWNDVQGGGEVGDLCQDELGLGLDVTMAGSFTAQRIWSVSRAAQGKNPCVPVPSGEVYFSAAPEKAMFVMDVGETRVFRAKTMSDSTSKSWYLAAQDWTDPTTAYLQLSVSGAGDGGLQVTSGQVVEVTMKLLADPGPSALGEADGVLLSTDTADPTVATTGHVWPFAVMSKADALDAGVMEPMHRPHRGRHARPRRR